MLHNYSFQFFFLNLCCSILSWRRQWHPTAVLLPGKSHGRRILVGCSPWGREESDTTDRLADSTHFIITVEVFLSIFLKIKNDIFIHKGRRKRQPTPVFLPRESCGQRSLMGCCLWGRTESDTTEET